MATSSNLTVNVSGCVWSSLFLDHASSMGDQEGFLFGEIRRQTSEDISDSQITRKTEQISINIYSHYACEEPFSFYDRRGHADQVKLLSMLKDKYKHTIGWYRFRRNTVLEPTMREATIHRELLNLFHSDTSHLFLLGLFTSGMAWNQATHYFNHQLLMLGDRGFKWLGVKVINLGDTSHSEYRESASMGTLAKDKGIYSNILNDFRRRIIDVEGSLHGVRVIQGINESVYSKMQTLKNKIGESEQQLQIEIEEVRELQRERTEQQRREVQHEPSVAMTDVDIPVLAKAIIHHPTPPGHQKELLKPSLATAYSNSPSNVPRNIMPSHRNGQPHSAATSGAPTSGAATSGAPTSGAPTSGAPTSGAPTSGAPTSTVVKEAAPKVAVVSPDGSNKDPFAGLFKDMKRSIQKTSSVGDELRTEDGPRSARAQSWDKAKELELRSSPSKSRAWSSMDLSGRSPTFGSSPMQCSVASGEGSSPQQWNTEDSDDATQLPEYPSSASPTF